MFILNPPNASSWSLGDGFAHFRGVTYGSRYFGLRQRWTQLAMETLSRICSFSSSVLWSSCPTLRRPFALGGLMPRGEKYIRWRAQMKTGGGVPCVSASWVNNYLVTNAIIICYQTCGRVVDWASTRKYLMGLRITYFATNWTERM